MRKFRAWDKDNKKWVEARSGGQSLVDRKLQYTYHRDLTLQDWETFRTIGAFPANYEIMQFTGLYDKNGKEIYEGDIVTWHQYGENNEVFFSNGSFRIKQHPHNNDTDILGELNYNACEVVGNIYERPLV